MQYIRIRNLREDMDMTQTDMAKVLFISQRTYSYYESGGHDIPTEVLVRINYCPPETVRKIFPAI